MHGLGSVVAKWLSLVHLLDPTKFVSTGTLLASAVSQRHLDLERSLELSAQGGMSALGQGDAKEIFGGDGAILAGSRELWGCVDIRP